MAWVRLLGSSPLLVGLFVFAMVQPTVGVGIQAAENATIDGADARANVTSAVETAERNVSAKMDGVRGQAAMATAGPYLDIVDAVLGSAFDFGYEHPDAAAWYRRLSPGVVGLGLLAYAYSTYRDIVSG